MAHGPDTELHKGLRQRHLTMIAIGGVIGAGLFVGSGVVINTVGPGAFLTYAVTGVVIVMIMRMLGAMATASPSTGSFADYARHALGGSAGASAAHDRDQPLLGPLVWRVRVLVRQHQGRRDLRLSGVGGALRHRSLARPRSGLLQPHRAWRFLSKRDRRDLLRD